MSRLPAKIFDNEDFQIELFRLIKEHENFKFDSDKDWGEASDVKAWDLSNIVNGKRTPTQEKFDRLLESVPISRNTLEDLEKRAKKNILSRKFWYEIRSDKEMSYREIVEELKKVKDFSEAQIKRIDDFIHFQESQNKN